MPQKVKSSTLDAQTYINAVSGSLSSPNATLSGFWKLDQKLKGDLEGNAKTASALLASVNLNGTGFDGSASINILNGATLTWGSSSPWTAANMYVYTGGTLQINTLFTMNSAGTFEVEDGGTVNFNYGSYGGSSLSTSLWNGTEKFHPHSNFIIQNQASATWLRIAAEC